MRTSPSKKLLYMGLTLCGLVCVGFAFYQQQYLRAIAQGNEAVTEQRFDVRHYEQARHFWLASRDRLLFNEGVLAFRARNLPRAAEYFRQAHQQTTNQSLRIQSQYNLGMVMLALEEVEQAAEFFKETLRLDPQDKAAKFNLERLYHLVLRRQGDQSEAALKQAPGTPQDQDKGRGTEGQGRSKSKSGI